MSAFDIFKSPQKVPFLSLVKGDSQTEISLTVAHGEPANLAFAELWGDDLGFGTGTSPDALLLAVNKLRNRVGAATRRGFGNVVLVGSQDVLDLLLSQRHIGDIKFVLHPEVPANELYVTLLNPSTATKLWDGGVQLHDSQLYVNSNYQAYFARTTLS